MEPDGGELWDTGLKSRDGRKPLLVVTHGTNVMKNGVLGNSSVIECRLQWIRKKGGGWQTDEGNGAEVQVSCRSEYWPQNGKKGRSKARSGKTWREMEEHVIEKNSINGDEFMTVIDLIWYGWRDCSY